MAVPTYTTPTANADTSTEEPKIITALAEIKSILSGALDSSNLAASSVGNSELANDAVTASKIQDGSVGNAEISASAAIAASKIGALASGKILLGNGSGVAAAVTPDGPVTIDNTGTTSLSIAAGSDSGDAIGTGGSNSLCDIANPEAGSYVTIGTAMVRHTTSTTSIFTANLRKNSTDYGFQQFRQLVTASDDSPISCIGLTTANGTDDFTWRFDNNGFSTITVYFGVMVMVRYA